MVCFFKQFPRKITRHQTNSNRNDSITCAQVRVKKELDSRGELVCVIFVRFCRVCRKAVKKIDKPFKGGGVCGIEKLGDHKWAKKCWGCETMRDDRWTIQLPSDRREYDCTNTLQQARTQWTAPHNTSVKQLTRYICGRREIDASQPPKSVIKFNLKPENQPRIMWWWC